MNVLNTLSFGVQVMLIGMAVVFTGLLILIAMITIMGKVLHREEKPKAAPAPAPAPAPVAETEVYEEVTDDSELIAVITAALMNMLEGEAENSDSQLVIRKIRRVNRWQNTARGEQISRF